MADLDRVKRNVQRMIKLDAPETDIDEYISSEGATLDQVRAHKVGAATEETAHSKKQFFDTSEQQARAEAADVRVAKERQEQGPLRTGVRDAARNYVKWSPVGSWLDEANSGLADVANRVTGGRVGEPYQDRMDYQAAYDRATDADSPQLGTLPLIGDVTAGGLTKLAGGVASAVATGGTGIGAQMARYPVASGAVFGGVYGAGEGQGTERGTNALIGSVTGAIVGKAAPFLGKRVNNTYNYLMDRARPTPPPLAGYDPGAVNKILAGVEDSNLFVPSNANNYSAQKAMLGPEGMLGDMSDRLRGQTYAVGTNPGESQQIVRNALMPRADEAASRIENTVNTAMGPPRNLVQETEKVLSTANKLAKPYYDAFYSKTIPVTPQLESVLQRVSAAKNGQSSIMALAERKAQMEGFQGGGALTGRHLDYIKRALDDVAFDPNTARDDARIFKSMVKDLKTVVNDRDWDVARQMAGSGQQFRQGIEDGAEAFKRGTDPDLQASELAKMPYVQKNGYFEGARGAVRDVMGESGTKFGPSGDTAAMRLFGTNNGQRRLANVVTPQSARDITNRVKAEREFAKTKDAVYGNSLTEPRQTARKEFPSVVDTSGANVPHSIEQAVGQVFQKVVAATRNEALNEGLAREAADAARLLTAQGVPRDQIAAGLRRLSRSRGASAATAKLAGDLAQALLRSSSPAATDAFARR